MSGIEIPVVESMELPEVDTATVFHDVAELKSCAYRIVRVRAIGEKAAVAVFLLPDPSGKGVIYADFILDAVSEDKMRVAFPIGLTGRFTGRLLSRERVADDGRTFTDYRVVPTAPISKDAASLAAANNARKFAGIVDAPAPKASAERE